MVQVLLSVYGIALESNMQRKSVEGREFIEADVLMNHASQAAEAARSVGIIPTPYTSTVGPPESNMGMSRESRDPAVPCNPLGANRRKAADRHIPVHNIQGRRIGQELRAEAAHPSMQVDTDTAQHHIAMPGKLQAPIEPHLDRYYLAAAGRQLGLLADLMSPEDADDRSVPLLRKHGTLGSTSPASHPLLDSASNDAGLASVQHVDRQTQTSPRIMQQGRGTKDHITGPGDLDKIEVMKTQQCSGQLGMRGVLGRPSIQAEVLEGGALPQPKPGGANKLAEPFLADPNGKTSSPQGQAQPMVQSAQQWRQGWMEELAAVVSAAASAATTAVHAQCMTQATPQVPAAAQSQSELLQDVQAPLIQPVEPARDACVQQDRRSMKSQQPDTQAAVLATSDAAVQTSAQKERSCAEAKPSKQQESQACAHAPSCQQTETTGSAAQRLGPLPHHGLQAELASSILCSQAGAVHESSQGNGIVTSKGEESAKSSHSAVPKAASTLKSCVHVLPDHFQVWPM
jgi:hypothetical protein